MYLRNAHAALADLPDLELVVRSQLGCQDALQVLITRYRRFARSKARGYFLVGSDRDDVEQEALIGLYKAARDFRVEHESPFRAFAELCVTRQILTAIKTATRQKHEALNQYVSLSGERPGDHARERALEVLIHVNCSGDDPLDRLVAADRFGLMQDRLAEMLSTLEVDVLALYLQGRSYQEIGDQLDRHVKAIDNALQRVKRKLEVHLADRALADRQDDLALIA